MCFISVLKDSLSGVVSLASKSRMIRVPIEFYNVINSMAKENNTKRSKILRNSAVIIQRADNLTALFFGKRKK